MIFSQISYFLLLIFSLIVFFNVPKPKRKLILALTGSIFYAYFAGLFFLLLIVQITLVYFLALKKNFWLALNLSILVLVYFKYKNLLITSLNDLSNFVQLGLALPVGKLAIPLAISFFTFEFIHFIVDKRNGKIKKASFTDLCAFILFFPTMIAGPIKRFQKFDIQINKAEFKPQNVFEGGARILLGMFKKFVISDTLANIIGSTFLTQESVVSSSPSLLWISLISYSFRIYLDFSGYSDIAIGSAKLFGISIPENFLSPYLKPNIAAFWKNWHKTLYDWIVDYIYIPLGGNRGGLQITIRNIFVAFSITGIWHGASWNFLLWGLYHAVLISAYRIYQTLNISLPKLNTAGKFISVSITFILVSFGWLLFITTPEIAFIAALKMLGLK